jgi:3-dehydroquinate dehydratase-2
LGQNAVKPLLPIRVSHLLLLNGPNLNLLGTREISVYGATTLAQIETDLVDRAARLGHRLRAVQLNQEGLLVEAIHQAKSEGVEFILFNPGAFTHTSVALRDALLGVELPFIEVHLSNVFARETFRHHSYLSDIAAGVIVGLGPQGYQLALTAADDWLRRHATLRG